MRFFKTKNRDTGTTCVVHGSGHGACGSYTRRARCVDPGVMRRSHTCAPVTLVRSRAGQHARPARPERCTDSFGVSGFRGKSHAVNARSSQYFRGISPNMSFVPGVPSTSPQGVL